MTCRIYASACSIASLALLLGAISCGRIGYDSITPPGEGDGAPELGDGGASADDASSTPADASPALPDASPDDPCRDPANWSCPQEGGGDCRAFCAGFNLEIFTSSMEYLCFLPGGGTVTCSPPSQGNCAGCLEMAQAQCCFQ